MTKKSYPWKFARYTENQKYASIEDTQQNKISEKTDVKYHFFANC